MSCHAFDRWLDDGAPEAGRGAALAHGRTCARCTAAMRAADELERLLGAPVSPTPRAFTDRVMAQVALGPQARPAVPVAELLPLSSTLPWWVRAALDPATLLASVLAGALVWRGDALFALASRGAVDLALWIAQSTAAPGPAGPPSSLWLQPVVLTCAVLGAAPLAVLGSRLVYRWTADVVGPPHVVLRGR